MATKKPRKRKSYEKYQHLGSLWVKKSRKHKGMQFLGGFINLPNGGLLDIYILFNLNKVSATSPDYHIYRDRRRELEAQDKPKTEGEAPCKEQDS